ncbi:Hypothetical predicted protein [Pelobates cultripes]|uniref:Uncharacterized protein n=1 Tax=Pelobates cultripes TaxID=61616 RepID=A0AAD1W1Y4_PELCU|nr:Hypothetical predicted protein [Pelobates cultripes]
MHTPLSLVNLRFAQDVQCRPPEQMHYKYLMADENTDCYQISQFRCCGFSS